MLFDITFFILTLAILVTFHEFGHFWVARRCGVRVLRFSVGFGSPLVRWRDRQGTEYVIAAIPLGGYVKMLDEAEGPVSPSEVAQAFNRQSAWRRAAIVSAGPLANFLLAWLVYWLVFVSGVPGIKPVIGEVVPGSVAEQAGLVEGVELIAVDGTGVDTRADVTMALANRLGDSGSISLTVKSPVGLNNEMIELPIDTWLAGDENPVLLASLGFAFWLPEAEPVIDDVAVGMPAAAAGIQPGDRILRIDQIDIINWSDVVEAIGPRVGETVDILVERDQTQLDYRVFIESQQAEDGSTVGRIGIRVKSPDWPEEMQVTVRKGMIEGLFAGLSKTGQMIAFTFESIKKMIVGLISPSNLGGPVTIAKIASASAQSGLSSYLQILALLSISLGVFNLLPIPILDGGHLLMIGLQAVTRRPLPEKFLIGFQQTGLVLILSIMIFALYNDIARL